MADEEQIEQAGDAQPPTPEELVGNLPDGTPITDGTILPDGDKVVYEYNEDGTFAGWHKEV